MASFLIGYTNQKLLYTLVALVVLKLQQRAKQLFLLSDKIRHGHPYADILSTKIYNDKNIMNEIDKAYFKKIIN